MMYPQEEHRATFLAALYGYFDESGKHHDHDVVVFSGFLSTWKAWETFNDEWNTLLRQNNLAALHLKEHKRRTSLMKKAIRTIKKNIEYGISVAISVRAFDALPRVIKEQSGGTAGYFAFRSVVLGMRMHSRAPDGEIHFTCDEDEETTLACYHWYKQIKREIPWIKDSLASFCVADDRFLPQLQAADIFAGLNRQEANRVLMGSESDTVELFGELIKPEENSKLGFKALYLDENTLTGFVEEWNRNLTTALRGATI